MGVSGHQSLNFKEFRIKVNTFRNMLKIPLCSTGDNASLGEILDAINEREIGEVQFRGNAACLAHLEQMPQ